MDNNTKQYVPDNVIVHDKYHLHELEERITKLEKSASSKGCTDVIIILSLYILLGLWFFNVESRMRDMKQETFFPGMFTNTEAEAEEEAPK